MLRGMFGPNGFEAELHDSAEFVADGKVGGAIEFSDGPAIIMDSGWTERTLCGASDRRCLDTSRLKYQISQSVTDTSMGTSFTTNRVRATITSNLDSVVVRGCIGILISGQKDMGPFNGADVDTTVSLPNLGLKPDTWYHVVGTFDDEKLEVYLSMVNLWVRKRHPNNGPVMVWNDNNIEIGGQTRYE